MDEIMAEQKQQEELQQENEVLDKKQLKAVEGGESIEKLFERTGDFLRNVVEPQLEDGKNIVIIGHGAMNSGIICQVRGLSTEHFWDAGINQCELLQLK